MGDQTNMCGSCLKMDINTGCAELGGGVPGYGERCKFRPSRWQDKHEGKGRKFGYPQEWHLVHEKPQDQVSFTTKSGMQISFKKGAKSAKKSKSKSK